MEEESCFDNHSFTAGISKFQWYLLVFFILSVSPSLLLTKKICLPLSIYQQKNAYNTTLFSLAINLSSSLSLTHSHADTFFSCSLTLIFTFTIFHCFQLFNLGVIGNNANWAAQNRFSPYNTIPLFFLWPIHQNLELPFIFVQEIDYQKMKTTSKSKRIEENWRIRDKFFLQKNKIENVFGKSNRS